MRSKTVLLSAILFLAHARAYDAPAQDLLDPLSQTKFVNVLPKPPIMQPVVPGGTHYEIAVTQFKQSLGLRDPATGDSLLTTVWGYNGSYPAATIEARKNVPITVLWKNELKDSLGNLLPHLLPIDTTVHWAHPEGYPASGIPVVTHLHGGHVESASDGLPEAWFTPDVAQTGPNFVKQIYLYDNSQDAATLWYHDHVLGITRLNVYAGLAGFYLLRDDAEDSLGLPSGEYEVPIVIQDRMFTRQGDLFYPSTPEMPHQPEPSILPEFFGNMILVNGKAWPVLNVEPRKYRFRMLNGSDSRFYQLWLEGADDHTMGPKFNQIGTDGGLLDAPVALESILIAPGERMDVVIDFAQFRGQRLVVRNDASEPFPDGDPVDPNTAGQIMLFNVSTTSVIDSSVLPANLRPTDPIVRLTATTADTTRELLLFEGEDELGRLLPLLGTSAEGPLRWDDPITENPKLNSQEVWTIINTTPDAHPIHLHLVMFQILDRQPFDEDDFEPGNPNSLVFTGPPIPPGPEEQGYKDTHIAPPGHVTRVTAKFDREGSYVWHCHILSHEDHEMMRPYFVGALPTSLDGDPETLPVKVALEQNYPNPFNPSTTIRYSLPRRMKVILAVYNTLGQRVAELVSGEMDAGVHELQVDASALASGMYFYRMHAGSFVETKRFVLVR